jgi:hypothetical protein
MLFEDGSVYAVGIYYHTVELIPVGVLELPVLYFAARINCTTVVGHGGLQVLQLWKD